MMKRLSRSLVLLLWAAALPAAAADLKEDLWAAAKKGDAAKVTALLGKGVDVNAKTAYGATALSFAADKGHLEVVKVLVKHKADINVKDTFYKFTPLNWAVFNGHAAIVGVLLEAGASGADDALVSAVGSGKVDLVQAVLDKGKPKAEALNKALASTSEKQTEIRQLLTKAGAKVVARPEVQVDAKTLQGYAGNYRSDHAELQVVHTGGKLVVKFGTTTLYTLKPVDKTTFQPANNATITIGFQSEKEKVTSLTMKWSTGTATYGRIDKAAPAAVTAAVVEEKPVTVAAPKNWPSFRGANASGVADGQLPVTAWDVAKGIHVRWKTPIPGLGNSCPVVWGDNVFVTTAVGEPKAGLKTGLYGSVDSVKDSSKHRWCVYCLDKRTGKVLWEKTAHEGVPRVKRHPKSTHANSTPATDGRCVVACFGSEGLYCYDFKGNLLWKQQLGTLDSGWFYDAEYQWGFGSSPILYRDLVIVQCDVGKNSFIAAYHLKDGQRAWLTERDEIPSWGTPTIYEGKKRVELVTNATKFARGYDPLTGKELWRLGKNSEITVPTPFAAHDLIFVTSGYRPPRPIYAIRPGASGDISLKDGKTSSDAIAWSNLRDGPYMPTPIVYGDYLYVCSNSGIVTCFEAKTGKRVYRERLGGEQGYTASPVAADGKLYFTGEAV
jgi:outer membrane protein assembly factor BamB